MGINRNIVECKWTGEAGEKESHSGINRNIVECKFRITRSLKQYTPVLIETLWNVNMESVP